MINSTIVSVYRLVTLVVFAGLMVADTTPIAPPPRPIKAERITATGRAFAVKGRIDMFVAATKGWVIDAEDDQLWDPALDLAWLLVQKSEFTMWPPESCRRAFSSMSAFRARYSPRFIKVDKPYQQEKDLPSREPRTHYPGGIMAPGVVSPAALGYNIIVSRHDVRTLKPIDNSIVYANGDITVGDFLGGSVVVCDGDVTVESAADGSLVIARGSIHVKGLVWGCTMVAGKKITIGNKLIRRQQFIVIEENEPNAFGFVNFFELSRVGVEVQVADGTVRVSAVSNGKPFPKAGVRVGDVVAAVNGKKPDSAESLRRLLRDALAVGDASVTLHRGEKAETVMVSLPE